MESVFVSAVVWVSKGFARRVPKQIEFMEEQTEVLRKIRSCANSMPDDYSA